MSQDHLSKKTNKTKSNLELSLICWTEWYACSHLASRKASIEIQHHNSIRLAHEHSINIYISPVHTLVLTITNSLKSISVGYTEPFAMYWHQVINTWRSACNVNSVLRWCLNQWSDEVNYYSSTECLDGQNVCIIYSICVLKSLASA